MGLFLFFHVQRAESTGRNTVTPLEHAGQGVYIGIAYPEGDLLLGQLAGGQQPLRLLQTVGHNIVLGGDTQLLLKNAAEVAAVEARWS